MYGAVMEKERKNGTSTVRSTGHSVRRENHTGIPTQLKERMEQSTGLSFDDVRVHYNSALPARLDALAYTQGNQVEIGPGQERHLPHELGHVVQQKLGAVRANATHSSGVALNTDPALEHQADEIGAGKKLAIVQRMRNNCIIQRCGDEEDSPEEEEKKDESQEQSPPGFSPGTKVGVGAGGSTSIKDLICELQQKTYQQLLSEGWQDVTDSRMVDNCDSKELYNSQIGLRIRFDPGRAGAHGFEGVDHYHVYNPNCTDKKVDGYIGKDGTPVGKGSKASHIVIGGGS